MRLDAYLHEWLARAAAWVSPRTVRNYRWAVQSHLNPTLGSTALDALTRPVVLRWTYDVLTQRGLAPATIRLIIRVLCVALSDAVDLGLLATNPAARLGSHLRRRLGSAYTPRPGLTPPELGRILETFRARSPRMFPLIMVLERTGLRIGEAVCLRWQDIDLDQARLYVTGHWIDGARVEGAKTTAEAQRVDLTPETVRMLRWVGDAPYVHPVWVFPNTKGNPWAVHWVEKRWRQLRHAAGLPSGRVLHGLRHFYCRDLLDDPEVGLDYVSQQARHASLEVTRTIYGGGQRRPPQRAALIRLDERRRLLRR